MIFFKIDKLFIFINFAFLILICYYLYMKNILITNVKSISCPFSSNDSGGRRNNRTNHALIFKFEGETIYDSNHKIIISNAENIAFLPIFIDIYDSRFLFDVAAVHKNLKGGANSLELN